MLWLRAQIPPWPCDCRALTFRVVRGLVELLPAPDSLPEGVLARLLDGLLQACVLDRSHLKARCAAHSGSVPARVFVALHVCVFMAVRV